MISRTTSVRVSEKLLKEARKAVNAGYYTSMNELIVSGIRREVYECNSAVKAVREVRDSLWKECMEKAGGNRKKAADLYFDEIKKVEKESPGFYK